MEIPTTRRRSLWESETLGVLVGGAGPVVAGCWTAYWAYHKALGREVFWPGVGAAAWASLAMAQRFFIARRKDKKAGEDESPNSLLGCMHVFHEAVRRRAGLLEAKDLRQFRATLFKVTRESHEQVLPYVGWSAEDPNRGPGRSWPNHCGLVGRIVREDRKDPLVARQPSADDDGYTSNLIAAFAYTRPQAELLSKGRLSAMAVPIWDGSHGRPIAAVYCDSSDPEFFNDGISELAVAASAGMATFIKLRYNA